MRAGGLAGAITLLAAAPLAAQIRTVDPNQAGALARPTQTDESSIGGRTGERSNPAQEDDAPATPPLPRDAPSGAVAEDAAAQPAGTTAPPAASEAERQARASAENSYAQQDVLVAADGVFGKGASGLAKLVERIFRDQGRPSAYIAGHEAGGAFVVGLRYGSGTLFHKVEGKRAVHWTGPSVGFDFGGSASKVFVLVYNLYDSQELYKRFPAAEGQVYVVGGFTASYLRWKDVVLIPIRLGVGWRLGANLGYMNFSEKMRLVPF